MKKTFSLSGDAVDYVVNESKRQDTTQSNVVEQAIMMMRMASKMSTYFGEGIKKTLDDAADEIKKQKG